MKGSNSKPRPVLARGQRPAVDYWIQCVKTWYPHLNSQTYFLPPVHFNRVPYSVEVVAGEQVLVPQIPQDEPGQTSSIDKFTTPRSRRYSQEKTPISSSDTKPSTFWRCSQGNLNFTPVQNSDVRDDRALQSVLHGLHALADKSQPKEVMMVISQLQFGKYLGEPCYAAVVDLLPRLSTLPDHYRQKHYTRGDFDVLIIHRQYGLFTIEIKSVGEDFRRLKMTEQQEDVVVIKKLKHTVEQMYKSEAVLKHLISDLSAALNITKTFAMPFINSSQLLRAINRYPSIVKDLCQCLGVQSVDDVVKVCLLSDQLSDINLNDIKFLDLWWHFLVRAGPQPLMTSTDYEQLVARFCGPATTVEVHCVTAPRLAIRTLGEGVSETGERMARLVLFPQQVDILNQSPPRVFLSGPPGTGKTVVLILQGLSWLKRGHDVHVVSTCRESRAVTIVIEHQLQRTTKVTSRIHRHQFDFGRSGEKKTAVQCLVHLSEGRQLCLIADEAIYNSRKPFTQFCDHLIVKVPGVYIWGASVRHGARPACLEEIRLTAPLRSPPVVVRELIKSPQFNSSEEVHSYTVSDVPVPTEGPEVIRIKHRDGPLSDHTGEKPRDCEECGRQVARILSELNVGMTDMDLSNMKGPPPLQYRDVLVLRHFYPTDDRRDKNYRESLTSSGLVRGLRACHVPVRVVEKDDEVVFRDTALGVSDMVTVAYWRDVQGLEKKVVVVENQGDDFYEKLYAMSRCTSQLVLIDFTILR